MNMTKRFTWIVAVVAVLLGFTACDNASYLTASTESVESEQEANEGTIALSSDGKKYEITHSPEWVTVTLVDSILSYNIGANDTQAVRTDSIVVTCGGMSLCIPVTQNIKATYIKVDQESVTFEKEGGTQTVNIDTDGGNITTEVTGDITASVEGKTLTINAAANDGGSKSGEVTVKCDDFSAKVKVTIKGSICVRCKGSGRVKCSACGGSGMTCARSHWDPDFNDYNCDYIDNCGRCGGSGRRKCPDCKGAGR